jgi:hypothetical protein
MNKGRLTRVVEGCEAVIELPPALFLLELAMASKAQPARAGVAGGFHVGTLL